MVSEETGVGHGKFFGVFFQLNQDFFQLNQDFFPIK